MLDGVETLFDDMRPMMRKLKKASYKERMAEFRLCGARYFDEMRDRLEGTGYEVSSSDELADCLTSAVRARFERRGKVPGYIQADLNFFAIYYVFPAILEIEGHGEELAEALKRSWALTFPGNEIGYTTYDSLYETFREKIFGIL